MYVQNITPHHVLNNKTPKEDFSGKKSEFMYIRLFVYPMYVIVPNEKRKNVDPTRNTNLFMGYIDESKAYQIYFPGFKKIETS